MRAVAGIIAFGLLVMALQMDCISAVQPARGKPVTSLKTYYRSWLDDVKWLVSGSDTRAHSPHTFFVKCTIY